jgi:hypothetical protein
MSCKCLVFKSKLFWRFVALATDREKAEGLRINGLQIDQQFVFKSLQSIDNRYNI